MTDRKRPLPASAEKYRKEIAERKKTVGRPMRIPNLNEAASLVDHTSPPRTILELGAMAEESKKVEAPQGSSSGLSPATVDGLRAIKAATEAAQKKGESMEAPTVPEAKGAVNDPEVIQREAPRSESLTSQELDDLDLGAAMLRIQRDVINNDEQRKLIESRVEPIDIKRGIATGTFDQHVPIVPDILEVWFRSVTPFEHMRIRRMLIAMAEADPLFESLSIETFNALNIAASIKQVNGEKWPDHIDYASGSPNFDADVLRHKLDRLLVLPAPVFHSLGVHCSWFDIRCREGLRVPALKGG